METQVLIRISAMIDKMGIDLSIIQGKDNEEVGTKVLTAIIKNIHKAEQELYELIALKQGISIEEAKTYDVIKFFTDLLKQEGLKDFLA